MTSTVTSQPMKRVEDWKSRLIDLSRRNNLLYFKKNRRRSLPISQPEVQTIFNLLVMKKRALEFWLPPAEKSQFEILNKTKSKGKGKAKTVKVTAKTALKESTIEEPKQHQGVNQLVTGTLSREDLERTLKGLQWRSVLDYRERGVRILHAAFGTLNWVDQETRENVQSPLILVPLELTKRFSKSTLLNCRAPGGRRNCTKPCIAG